MGELEDRRLEQERKEREERERLLAFKVEVWAEGVERFLPIITPYFFADPTSPALEWVDTGAERVVMWKLSYGRDSDDDCVILFQDGTLGVANGYAGREYAHPMKLVYRADMTSLATSLHARLLEDTFTSIVGGRALGEDGLQYMSLARYSWGEPPFDAETRNALALLGKTWPY